MKKARVYNHGEFAGILTEEIFNKAYRFRYEPNYSGEPISLTMPLRNQDYFFDVFPPFFEGLLPEGGQLEGLLELSKIDRNDYLSQLIATGGDLTGSVTVVADSCE